MSVEKREGKNKNENILIIPAQLRFVINCNVEKRAFLQLRMFDDRFKLTNFDIAFLAELLFFIRQTLE